MLNNKRNCFGAAVPRLRGTSGQRHGATLENVGQEALANGASVSRANGAWHVMTDADNVLMNHDLHTTITTSAGRGIGSIVARD